MLDARNLLAQLQLTEAEIDVYLVMLKGAGSAREVINSTNRSRPTVYYALSALERRGLITKQGNSEEYRFQVEPLSGTGRVNRVITDLKLLSTRVRKL